MTDLTCEFQSTTTVAPLRTTFGSEMVDGNGRHHASHVADVIDECMSDGWLTEEQGVWDEDEMVDAYGAANFAGEI